ASGGAVRPGGPHAARARPAEGTPGDLRRAVPRHRTPGVARGLRRDRRSARRCGRGGHHPRVHGDHDAPWPRRCGGAVLRYDRAARARRGRARVTPVAYRAYHSTTLGCSLTALTSRMSFGNALNTSVDTWSIAPRRNGPVTTKSLRSA